MFCTFLDACNVQIHHVHHCCLGSYLAFMQYHIAGYIMDRRVGNTKKMGALFGILAAIDGPIPEPETIPYAFFILSNRLSSIFSSKLCASRGLQPV